MAGCGRGGELRLRLELAVEEGLIVGLREFVDDLVGRVMRGEVLVLFLLVDHLWQVCNLLHWSTRSRRYADFDVFFVFR